VATVFEYPQLVKLLPLVPTHVDGEIGRRIRESAALMHDYRGYVWSEWFNGNLPKIWTLFAVLLGTGGLLAQSSGGGTLFTLSLPVSRRRLFAIRSATGLAELLALALVPSLLLPLLSPAIGQSCSVADMLVHSACLFVAGSVFFGLASFLSAELGDFWRPLLIALPAAVVIGLCEQLLPAGIFHVMSGESYFRHGQLPWIGLLLSAALSAALQFGAAATIARRDF
jgi:hypothetical protein